MKRWKRIASMKNYLKLLNDAQILQLLHVEEKGINSLGNGGG